MLVIILFNVFLGFKRGIIAEVLTLVGLIAVIFIAIFWYADLSSFLMKQFKWNQPLSHILSFILIFIAVIMTFRLFEYLLSHITALLLLNWINNLGGALFGFIRGAIIVGLLLFIVNFIPLPLEINYQIKESIFAEFFLKGLIIVYNSLREWMPNHFQFDMESIKKII
ncbi:MAG: CvpA family protein [Atribacterota bacterium]|nr:CvpA family protein [Atribacterota bacterium]